jgi:hypothetical protein
MTPDRSIVATVAVEKAAVGADGRLQ